MTFDEQVRDLTAAGMRLKDAHKIVMSVVRARFEQIADQTYRQDMEAFEAAWDGSGLEGNTPS